MRGALASLVLALGLVLAPTASGATFTDPAGDANDAPDITSVTVSDPQGEIVTIRVSIRNFSVLPADAKIAVALDLDGNASTGASGAELVVEYAGDGSVTPSRWDGFQLSPFTSPGIAAAYSNGVLQVTIDRGDLANAASFGIRVISSRTETIGLVQATGTDYAPTVEQTVTGPGETTIDDPAGDEDTAPDITRVDVSDSAAGRITFRIATPNDVSLPPDALFGLDLDLAGRPASADEVFVTYLSSLRSIEIEREVRGSPRPVDPPYRASAAYADGVLTLTLDRSLIDDAGSFRFSLVTADLVGPGEPEGKGAEGRIEALDVAPDGLVAGKQLAYRLSHAPPIHLEAADPVSSPTGFRPGQKVVVAVVVRRSDTFGVVRTGSVRCTAAAGGKALPTTGSFAGGRAQCLFAVPTGSRSGRARGTIAVRALGAAVRLPFAYPSR